MLVLKKLHLVNAGAEAVGLSLEQLAAAKKVVNAWDPEQRAGLAEITRLIAWWRDNQPVLTEAQDWAVQNRIVWKGTPEANEFIQKECTIQGYEEHCLRLQLKSLEHIDIKGIKGLLCKIHSVYDPFNQEKALKYLKSQQLPPKSLFTIKWGAQGEEGKVLTPTSGGGVTMDEHDAMHACKCLDSGYTTKTILNKLIADHGNQRS